MVDYIAHIGTKYHSGRYPYGSGENPYQHDPGFYGQVLELRKEGMSDAQIAKARGLSSNQLRAYMTIERNRIRKANEAEALRLLEKGYSKTAIGERMGVPESTVRNWLNPALQAKNDKLTNTANALKNHMGDGYLDIGAGSENQMGVSQTMLRTAANMLEAEGYHIYRIKENQVFGNGQKTDYVVLAPPDATFMDVVKNKDRIQTIRGYSDDNMQTFHSFKKVNSVDGKRVFIRYGDKGGSDRDGLVELRPGVDDISLGGARYAQVRIGVDGTHYMKGMAVYSDDIPKGYDIVYNTNKKSGTEASSVFKEMKDVSLNDPGIFGAIVRQREYVDANGKKHLSAINIVNEEGDWSVWSKTLSSQVLSKQSPELAKELLDKDYNKRVRDWDDIKSLTNPSVKQKLMAEFADNCDSAAVHLKAAAMPRQATHVILPVQDLKPTEIFAPNYRNGERVVLVRYPHGGKFEMPELIVNNRRSSQTKYLQGAKDAVAIHPSVAQQLSGADFDGDTVLVIPNNQRKLKTKPPLDKLKDFDPKIAYPAYEGMRVASERTKQIEMGKVSNLITDMTIRGADDAELARAVKHSMVVIDCVKHKLNYKQSFEDNGIAQLKEKYQGGANAGASTLISKASSQAHPLARKEITNVFRMTPEQKRDYDKGYKIYETTGETYINKAGKTVKRTANSTKMYEERDARKLSSGTEMEEVYARYANQMKALGLKARAESRSVRHIQYSPSAAKVYEKEVASLRAKVNEADKNRPQERAATLVANQIIRAKIAGNPYLKEDDDALKKVKSQALTEARARTGASKPVVDIKPNEWNAIQSGAVNRTLLDKVLMNADPDQVKKLATPKQSVKLPTSVVSRIKAMSSRGMTQAEIADALSISVSTVNKTLS